MTMICGVVCHYGNNPVRAAAATAAFLTAITVLASVTVAELEMKR